MWSLEYADAQFSNWIRTRDGKCQFPYCNQRDGLDNSHFHLRHHSATRYEPDNCIALCRTHHEALEHPVPTKNPEYIQLMLKRLGTERYKALAQRANSIFKRDAAIINVMALIGQPHAAL